MKPRTVSMSVRGNTKFIMMSWVSLRASISSTTVLIHTQWKMLQREEFRFKMKIKMLKAIQALLLEDSSSPMISHFECFILTKK